MDVNKLRFLVIGAHPDDCDGSAGGTAIKLVNRGHVVKFLSVTNGSAGHQTMSREQIKDVRLIEAANAGKTAGVEYQVLDIDDGLLTPSLENRDRVMGVIRAFNPDVILTHRTNDYHPDHRNTGVIVQDCSYLMMVPNVLPGVTPLDHQPVICFMSDGFKKPYPFCPDIVCDISDVLDAKLRTMACHKSQYFDWLLWVPRLTELLNAPEEIKMEHLRKRVYERSAQLADKYRDRLIQLYGEEEGKKVRHAEAFEISEFGGAPSKELLAAAFGINNPI